MAKKNTHSESRRAFCIKNGVSLATFLALNPFLSTFAQSPVKNSFQKNELDHSAPLLGFREVDISTSDDFRVPPGYVAEPFISWGDPIIANTPNFEPNASQDAIAQSGQFGDNNDGMSWFSLSENRAILAINHEYANHRFLFPRRKKALSREDVKKSQAAHGISIIEIERQADGRWKYLLDSPYNRRITANTPMNISGPVAGQAEMKTAADPSGRKVLGTINNCANGQTPWGTYLTCEENFSYYFAADPSFAPNPAQKRYGLGAKDKRNFQWYRWDERFNLSRQPNEANRFGWVVEIDPMDPQSTPIKRTALGRFKHENAALVLADNGQVVVYMGDDQGGEHIYKFVSKHPYQPEQKQVNRHLLDEGKLYVARFDSQKDQLKGQGEWIELSYGKNGLDEKHGFSSQAQVLLHTRLAASVVGGTPMDRPEWVAVHPQNKTVYATLTKNIFRGLVPGQVVGGPNPRMANQYGQIVRWWPKNGDHTATTFAWDLFVIAGNPKLYPNDERGGSANINPDNQFCNPDGIGFDPNGRLWILTDGNYSNLGDFSGMGNNQLLCADPNSGEIRRFATGPIGCEITGLIHSPDQKTLLVGVQHPGGRSAVSHFPDGGDSRPRSTIMLVRRKDGGIIGA